MYQFCKTNTLSIDLGPKKVKGMGRTWVRSTSIIHLNCLFPSPFFPSAVLCRLHILKKAHPNGIGRLIPLIFFLSCTRTRGSWH